MDYDALGWPATPEAPGPLDWGSPLGQALIEIWRCAPAAAWLMAAIATSSAPGLRELPVLGAVLIDPGARAWRHDRVYFGSACRGLELP